MLHGRCRYDRLMAVYLIVEVFNDGILMKNSLPLLPSPWFPMRQWRVISKAPVILFVIPGILPMVPGAGMYRIVY